METERICPKCKGVMLEGWIAEIGKGTMPIKWVAGKPEPSFWTGTKLPKERTFEVITYGCTECGYLESYANRDSPVN